VSHQPERKEKDCLNCGTIVQGRYCHKCGQENIVTHQSFLALTKHFIYDILHFDGKFFDTLRNLLFKPGIVAKEYISGKRGKYLDPIRMYLFTSAVFFLIFFSTTNLQADIDGFDTPVQLSNNDRLRMAEEYQADLSFTPNDTLLKQKIALLLDTTRPVLLADVLVNNGIVIKNRAYRSHSEYDSIQRLLPEKERDGWFWRVFTRKAIDINIKSNGDKERIAKSAWNSFVHRFPYMLFISLPFFAGLLKLLYIRRKTFYYSDHAVFTLYHYIFSFILLLIILGFEGLRDWLNWGLFGWLIAALIITWFIYLYKGLRNFYGQNRFKTISKLFLLMIAAGLLMVLLMLFFALFTAFQL